MHKGQEEEGRVFELGRLQNDGIHPKCIRISNFLLIYFKFYFEKKKDTNGFMHI